MIKTFYIFIIQPVPLPVQIDPFSPHAYTALAHQFTFSVFLTPLIVVIVYYC